MNRRKCSRSKGGEGEKKFIFHMGKIIIVLQTNKYLVSSLQIIVPWLYNVKVNQATDMYYKSARNLSSIYPHVEFYLLTPDKMKIAESLFQTETGLTR